jgi:hypothetical protein
MASLQERLDEFKIDRTYPGRWTITFTNPPINVFVPTTIVDTQRTWRWSRQGLSCRCKRLSACT